MVSAAFLKDSQDYICPVYKLLHMSMALAGHLQALPVCFLLITTMRLQEMAPISYIIKLANLNQKKIKL